MHHNRVGPHLAYPRASVKLSARESNAKSWHHLMIVGCRRRKQRWNESEIQGGGCSCAVAPQPAAFVVALFRSLDGPE